MEQFTRDLQRDRKVGVAGGDGTFGLDRLAAVIFRPSEGSKDGNPHIVTVHEDAVTGRYVSCTCRAMLSIGSRPAGCWAMKTARPLFGLEPID